MAPRSRPDRSTDPEARARLRLIEAVEEVRLAARALGMDSEAIGMLHTPLALRADAWLWRSSQLLDCPRCQRSAA
jgi:hypothetical protein